MMVTALLVVGCARSPEGTVEAFYTALGKGEIAAAQSCLSSQFTAMMGTEKLAGALAEASTEIVKCGGIKSIKVVLEGEGEARTGNATVVYGGSCQSKTEGVKLLREDGKWKLAPRK
jgi:hypothetical protein